MGASVVPQICDVNAESSAKEPFEKAEGVDPETIVRGVFKFLSKRITEGEIQDIKQILPPELRELWP
jgi:uncharacterized protein (DUF2267 family)